MQVSVMNVLLLVAMQVLMATMLFGTGAATPVPGRNGTNAPVQRLHNGRHHVLKALAPSLIPGEWPFPLLTEWRKAVEDLGYIQNLITILGYPAGKGGLECIGRIVKDKGLKEHGGEQIGFQLGYQVPGSGAADLDASDGRDFLVWGWPQRHATWNQRGAGQKFDSASVLHEYAYGLVRSLVDPSGSGCLDNTDNEGLGLMEGWADFITFLMLYRLEKGETRNNSVTTILSSGRKMTRPYSLDPSINNLTYATLNEAQYRDSVDGRYMGEIWAAVLLELMWNLVDKYKMRREIWPLLRKDKPGVPTDGRYLTLKIILGGMKELGNQCEGDYVAAARALLRSAEATTGSDDVCLVWRALAARGLGVGASKTTPEDSGEKRMFTASDMMPVEC